VVLVVVDTLRQDRVGCYGSEPDTTPHLDALAAEGVRFDNAYATAPWTSPSVASILTGLLPSAHGLVAARTGIADGIETLAEMLRAEGYATGGVVSNPHLKRVFAFDQGFDHWAQDQAQDHRTVSTPEVTRQATEMIDRMAASGRPFFLFVLYFDPHYDYVPHPEYGFATPTDAGRISGTEHMLELRELAPDMTPDEIGYIRDVYDEEVRFTDEGIGSLLTALRGAGVYENTAIVVTADHGEEFLERDWLGHCRTLYDELVKVPLIVRPPGPAAPRVVDTPISLVSVVPTLREVAGLAPAAPGVDAPSLLSLCAGESPPSWPPVFCEVDFVLPADPAQQAHKRALIQDGFKLVIDDATGVIELYDLARDPGERDDLAEARPELVASHLAVLESVHAAARENAAAGREVELTDDERAALEALGYAGEEPAGDEGPP
jgi:arylsulfatase